jgi:hypothetical protein
MALPVDPEEPVVLARHGVMPLRCAVARVMTLLPDERHAALIIRKGALSRSILNYERIKELAAHLATE